MPIQAEAKKGGLVWHGMVWYSLVWYGHHTMVGVPSWLKKGLWVGVPPLSLFGVGCPTFQSQKGLFVS